MTTVTNLGPNIIRIKDVGVQGEAGQGVPTGGTTGQLLAKNSNTNYDTEWVNIGAVATVDYGNITGTLSNQTDLQAALDGKVDENAGITGATKTKITYDAKGLVTAGADATTADVNDSSNRRYVTDAQLTVIGNTSGTNTGDQDLSGYELLTNKATDFTTLNNTLYPTTQAVADAISSATLSASVYMFSKTNSDISGYESMPVLSDYSSSSVGTVTQTVTTSPTLMEEFSTNPGQPNVTVLPIGVYTIHYDAQKASGSNTYFSYAEIYKRTSGGSETLISTSDLSPSSAVNTNQSITVTAVTSSVTSLNLTDRLVVKIYFQMATGSSSIDLKYDDATGARLQLPSSPLGYTPENVVNKSTDGTFAANSTTLYPSQSAAKTYSDTKIAGMSTVVDNRIVKTSGTTGLALEQTGIAIDDNNVCDWSSGQLHSSIVTLTDAANISWDTNGRMNGQVTLGGNRTLDNPTNLKSGATYVLKVIQDGTGGRTLAYGSAFKWSNGNIPVVSAAANAVDILTFWSDGTNLYGVWNENFS